MYQPEIAKTTCWESWEKPKKVKNAYNKERNWINWFLSEYIWCMEEGGVGGGWSQEEMIQPRKWLQLHQKGWYWVIIRVVIYLTIIDLFVKWI